MSARISTVEAKALISALDPLVHYDSSLLSVILLLTTSFYVVHDYIAHFIIFVVWIPLLITAVHHTIMFVTCDTNFMQNSNKIDFPKFLDESVPLYCKFQSDIVFCLTISFSFSFCDHVD